MKKAGPIEIPDVAVMGVLNVTPDSFSDGGQFTTRDRALRHAERMLADGAAIIDVGGESTRPGSEPVSESDELERVVPIVEALVAAFDACVSVDTSKPEVMRAAVGAGARMINDVRALRDDGAIDAVADLDCAICLMHMQGRPRSMQQQPVYDDVVSDVQRFLAERVAACEAADISRDRLLIDPGFGFGKTAGHNLRLLRELDAFESFGLPILVGLSRKATLGEITGRPVDERLPASIVAAAIAVQKGASIVRAHDVAATVDAIRVVRAVQRVQIV